MLLVLGLVIGCLNAWHWITKENNVIQAEQEDDNE
jgi:ATP synthase protein I